jgi:hypothetical protein
MPLSEMGGDGSGVEVEVERKKVAGHGDGGSVVFPPPASRLQSHVTAAAPPSVGIWAYAAETNIVIVRPPAPPRSASASGPVSEVGLGER